MINVISHPRAFSLLKCGRHYLSSKLRGREPLRSSLLRGFQQRELRLRTVYRDGRDDGVYALKGKDKTCVVCVVDYAHVDASVGQGVLGGSGEKDDGVFA